MTPFKTIESVAAPFMEENIDTDIIFPARFLLMTAREGLGDFAFHDRRAADPDFVLNRVPFRYARILIADGNFGSGSSREQAVWALAGWGFECFVAHSFGEIFQANCFRNGVLPVSLPRNIVSGLADRAGEGRTFVVDLEQQHIIVDGETTPFSVPPQQRLALLNGWDETETILHTQSSNIARFEASQRMAQPWLWEIA